jgi:hypothetical protein
MSQGGGKGSSLKSASGVTSNAGSSLGVPNAANTTGSNSNQSGSANRKGGSPGAKVS